MCLRWPQQAGNALNLWTDGTGTTDRGIQGERAWPRRTRRPTSPSSDARGGPSFEPREVAAIAPTPPRQASRETRASITDAPATVVPAMVIVRIQRPIPSSDARGGASAITTIRPRQATRETRDDIISTDGSMVRGVMLVTTATTSLTAAMALTIVTKGENAALMKHLQHRHLHWHLNRHLNRYPHQHPMRHLLRQRQDRRTKRVG